MDGEEIKNGQRYRCKLQIDERVKHKWSLIPKYKTNRIMQQIKNHERIIQKKYKESWKIIKWFNSQEG